MSLATGCDNAFIVSNDDPIHACYVAIVDNPRMQKIIFNLVDMKFSVVHDTVDVWIGPFEFGDAMPIPNGPKRIEHIHRGNY